MATLTLEGKVAFDSVRVNAVTVKPASSRAWTTAGPRFPDPYYQLMISQLLNLLSAWIEKRKVEHTPITATFLIVDILLVVLRTA